MQGGWGSEVFVDDKANDVPGSKGHLHSPCYQEDDLQKG